MDITTLGLIIQWIGTILVLSLLAFLAQSVRRPMVRFWSAGWLALVISLGALALAFSRPAYQVPLEAIYFFGEYVFAFCLISGCRQVGEREAIARVSMAWLPAGLATAVILSLLSTDFNVQIIPHAAIMGICFLAAFGALRPARRQRSSAGVTVMSAALLLLGIDFLHYVAVFAIAVKAGPANRFAYLSYTSVVDMVLEILLGFGMVMSILDTLRREAESANVKLGVAMERLEILARTDPLTNALNRHAYHALVGDGSDAHSATVSGCVVIADVDRLKEINDRLGHTAGDAAIRRVASALRSVIRADDLLFRWGGDEFLAILWNISGPDASRRFENLDGLLTASESAPQPLTVSLGFAPFDGEIPLERAIDVADSLMYRRKHQRSSSTE
jgi:diguanylate cyclase (GGDEF)-like protein